MKVHDEFNISRWGRQKPDFKKVMTKAIAKLKQIGEL